MEDFGPFDRAVGKGAPAAGELQEPAAGGQVEAVEDRIDLRFLRGFERQVGVDKKRARIIHPRIEPQMVEIIAQIIMGKDVALRSAAAVAVEGVDRSVHPAPRAPRSEEHTSELQSLMRISYAVVCLKKKIKQDD